MTEQTLFDMATPQQKARAEAKTTRKTRTQSWFPKTNGEMLMRGYDRGSGTLAICRACGEPIEFWTTPTGKSLPMNPMPTPETPAVAHWSTCTDPNRFRR